MLIQQHHRLIIYDIMLVLCLILTGYTIYLKIYVLTTMYLGIAFLSHSRLCRMLELKEELDNGFSEAKEI